ncbi:hypothetical protein ACQ4N7_26005 [Nodosilinea sp. AN01ver1]|uniref:hypothetical protein n=1 Tax=Nodosilinea sp. AN01ver1 TaxID=3423362 RepID=UPI003D3120D4
MALPLGTHTLDQTAGQPPRQSFRRVWSLALPPGQGILKVAPGAQIRAEFLPLTFNALASGAVVTASRSNQGGGVRVDLAVPLRLHRVRFAGGLSGLITVHRVDGSAIAEQPTTQATISGGEITLPQEFTDRQFVLKRADSSLTSSQIAQLWFTSYPTTPRLGLLDQSNSLISLWQAPGQLTTSSAQSRVNLADDDFQALERFLARQSLASFNLVAESDAPCRVEITQATLDYRRAYQGFTPNSTTPAKQVLRFQGDDLRPQAIALTLPPQVQAASLQLSVSLKGSQLSTASLTTATQTPPTQRQGIALLPQQWGGLCFTPPVATRYSGVTLGLLRLRSQTSLTIDLRLDDGKLPSSSLTQVSQTLQGATSPQWITVRFPDPVVLYRQPYWLLVSTSDPALWLTEVGTGEVYLLEQPPHQLWSTRQRYPNTQVLYQLLESASSSHLDGDAGAVGAGGHPALTLRLANVTLPTLWDLASDRVDVDLMAGLSSSQTDFGGALTIATAIPGIVTVYAPQIEYRQT